MTILRNAWNSLFDIREGELPRTLCMALYLVFVLFAYYILKPVSRALFISRFDIDKLPWLYILIAAIGGILAYIYTKIAVRASLTAAVNWTTAFFVGSQLVLWWLLPYDYPWIYYAFNIWVSLFSIILVTQGWVIAANVFHAREAKRLYGLLGLGAVVGAAFGGSFTASAVHFLGTRDLLLASAIMVIASYGAFRATLAQRGVSLAGAKGAEAEEADFGFRDIADAIRRQRHLQAIIAIMVITFIVDVMVEYQFNVMAKFAFPNQVQLTAFLGRFYGVYLNLITFTLQFFFIALVTTRFGVGVTLRVMPAAIGVASLATAAVPGLLSTAAARLTEASTRYSFNRTGMELLYMPLPSGLRNRTKTFVDVFVDRMARGLGGTLLLVLTTVLTLQARHVALLVAALSILWILLANRARKEYTATVRRRLKSRSLQLESVRISIKDSETLNLLGRTLESDNPRQVCYALSLLAETPGRRLEAQLPGLAGSPFPEVRAKVYEIGRVLRWNLLRDSALTEILGSSGEEDSQAVRQAARYLVAVANDKRQAVRRFLNHRNPAVVEGALTELPEHPEPAGWAVPRPWLAQSLRHTDPARRRLAAIALRFTACNSGGMSLRRLCDDPDVKVVEAAFLTASILRDRRCVMTLVYRLADPRLRGAAIQALAAYGGTVSGTLGDMLRTPDTPHAVRRQIPRVLKQIPEQRSVDALLECIGDPNLDVRTEVLRALNGLRESARDLKYGGEPVLDQILAEARYYFELNAALAPFRVRDTPKRAVDLLARTLEDRLAATLERMFRLLGLRYPPKEIYAAYLAFYRKRADVWVAALEFLENILDRSLKRVILPLLDSPENVSRHGLELFRVEEKDAESALRELLDCGDSWLAACAIAAAGELGMRSLIPRIEEISNTGRTDVGEVARSAVDTLAA